MSKVWGRIYQPTEGISERMILKEGESQSKAVKTHLRVLASLLVLGGLIAPSSALAAGDANVSPCGSQTEASAGFVAYLPDCRAYESVTPPYKESGEVVPSSSGAPVAVSADGSHVIANVGGAFAGSGNYWWQGNRSPFFSSYEFTRTDSGWTPTALTPPATEFPHSVLLSSDGSDLSTSLWSVATNALEFNEAIYWRGGDGTFSPVGPGTGPEVRNENIEVANQELELKGASQDLSHSIFGMRAFGPGFLEQHHGRNNLWPGDTTLPEANSLYEYEYHGQPNAEPTLVGVANQHRLASNSEAILVGNCGIELGAGSGGTFGGTFYPAGSFYNAVSASGETVFFTTLHATPSETCSTPAVDELYARISATRTVAISEPLLPAGACSIGEPCSGAEHKDGTFEGASEDGSRVFFLSEQALVNGAPSAGDKLYEARLEGAAVAEVIDVSPDPDLGMSPEVQGVVRISEDGTHVYFVAKAALTSTNAGGAAPQAGADNLYVTEPDPVGPGAVRTVFVATLLTSAEEAALSTSEAEEVTKVASEAEHAGIAAYETALSQGASEEEAARSRAEAESQRRHKLRGALGPRGTLEQDLSTWQANDDRPAQATPDGQFLVFTSSARLVPGDESTVPQVFEYSAQSERLTRVSIAGNGISPTADDVDTYSQAAKIPDPLYGETDRPTAAEAGLALSSDGARVFFTSGARLTSQVEDPGSPNVYEYTEGHVYLISDGKDASETSGHSSVSLFGADASGQDALFLTADSLAPQDPVGELGLYDARAEGGFPPGALASGCLGETCRGPSSTTPEAQQPATTGQRAGDNLSPAPPASSEKKSTSTTLTRAQKLAAMLRACKQGRKSKRVACERQAHRRYGARRLSRKGSLATSKGGRS